MTKACSGPDGKHVKIARVISGAELHGPSASVPVLLCMLWTVLQTGIH